MREIKFRGRCILTKRWAFGGVDLQRDNPRIITQGHRTFIDEKTVGQYTGLKDKNGTEIYEGDLINLFYTSKRDDWFFDGVYRVSITPTGVKLKFVNLLWECGGYNQEPYENADVSEFGFVRNDYKNTSQDHKLCVAESREWNYSNYFEVIGNVHENPELLERHQWLR